MITRKRQILTWAEEESQRIIDAVPVKLADRRSNLIKISKICLHLVDRRQPIYPSAEEVAESGRSRPFSYAEFISSRTIYNRYGLMLSTWRRAWKQIDDLQEKPSDTFEAVVNWDCSYLDSGAQANIRLLKQVCQELKRANDGLKQLISQNITVDLDESTGFDGSLIVEMSEWFEGVEANGLALDEHGLVVTRRSGPGTVVMEASLWEGLKRSIDAAQRNQNLRDVDLRE